MEYEKEKLNLFEEKLQYDLIDSLITNLYIGLGITRCKQCEMGINHEDLNMVANLQISPKTQLLVYNSLKILLNKIKYI